MSRIWTFAFVCAVACTTSGGVILGLGAFANRIGSSGLLDAEGLNIVFDFGFQMLTWMSLVWSALHDSLGPRGCAVLGLMIAAFGNTVIALAVVQEVRNPYAYAVGYGLIGGGGNGPYITAYHFANLFPAKRGLCISILAAAFNVAGYAYLVLNIPRIPLDTFFVAYAVYTSCCCVGVGAIYPDTPYVVGDAPGLRQPRLCPGVGTSNPLRATLSALRIATPELRKWRFWGYCLTFGWAALVGQWGAGAAGSGELSGNVTYLQWFVPVVINATFLLTPLIGSLIDRTGFCIPALLLVASMQLVVALMWAGGAGATWAVPVAVCVLGALAYTIEFAYLTLTFPAQAYPGLLTVTLMVQGALGFIAWPLLSTGYLFGCNLCPSSFLLLLLPSLPLYAWPLLCHGRVRKDEELLRAAARGIPNHGSAERRASTSTVEVIPAILESNTSK
jgi:hypothetical protein